MGLEKHTKKYLLATYPSIVALAISISSKDGSFSGDLGLVGSASVSVRPGPSLFTEPKSVSSPLKVITKCSVTRCGDLLQFLAIFEAFVDIFFAQNRHKFFL